MSTTNEIVQQLEGTKRDIEQFIYELTLEDTTAEERLEKLKAELRSEVTAMKESLDQRDIVTEEVAKKLKIKLSSLESHLQQSNKNATDDVQLFLGKIRNTLKEINITLTKENSFNETLEKIHDHLQRYKFKFEIIRLKLALGKLAVKYAGKEVQLQITQKINKLSNFIRYSEQDVTEKLKTFRSSVNKIYSDISKIYS